VRELAAQALEPACELHAHGPWRARERARDLARRTLLDQDALEHLAVGRPEPRQGRAHGVGELLLRQSGHGLRRGRRRQGPGVRDAQLAARELLRLAPQDPVEPALQAARLVEARGVLDRALEGRLDRVLGQVEGRHEVRRDRQELARRGVEDGRQRAPVATVAEAHEQASQPGILHPDRAPGPTLPGSAQV
jgi:hypothetical protein